MTGIFRSVERRKSNYDVGGTCTIYQVMVTRYRIFGITMYQQERVL